MKLYCAARGNQNGSAAVYSLLERALYREYGQSLPEIKKTPNGKPYFPACPEIFFSLSHSKTHVLCALSDCPVGVDIESPRVISPRAIKFFCSDDELELFEPIDLWLLKESYVKLTGSTLGEIKRIRFTRDGEKITAPGNETHSRLYSVAGCRAAVCALSDNFPDSVCVITRGSAFL